MTLHRNRKRIYTQLYTYEKRRDALLQKFGLRKYDIKPAEYKRQVATIEKTINRYRRIIVRIDQRSAQVIAIANAVTYFTGHTLKNSAHKKLIPRTAKGLFFKYGLENGVPGILLSDYVGTKTPAYAGTTRKWFTRSFKTHPENRESYARFKEFIKTYESKPTIK